MFLKPAASVLGHPLDTAVQKKADYPAILSKALAGVDVLLV